MFKLLQDNAACNVSGASGTHNLYLKFTGELKSYQDYYIKPAEQIDKRLIVEGWGF